MRRILFDFPFYVRNLKFHKGFTLIEVICALVISAIILTGLALTLQNGLFMMLRSETQDELNSNMTYTIEYLIDEIKSADQVKSLDGFPELQCLNPDLLGFVLIYHMPSGMDTYITYQYNKRKKCIQRLHYEFKGYFSPLDPGSGHNVLCEHLISVDGTHFDEINNMIYLSFTFEKEGIRKMIQSHCYLTNNSLGD